MDIINLIKENLSEIGSVASILSLFVWFFAAKSIRELKSEIVSEVRISEVIRELNFLTRSFEEYVTDIGQNKNNIVQHFSLIESQVELSLEFLDEDCKGKARNLLNIISGISKLRLNEVLHGNAYLG